MNSQEFVDIIKKVVLESSVESTKKVLERPPGRSPSKDLVELSVWYNHLVEIDKEMVIKIVAESVRGGVFGFLCVLDGVRAIEGTDKGTLKLYYEKGEERVLLNDQDRFGLHDML
jgi:hypothetical protein